MDRLFIPTTLWLNQSPLESSTPTRTSRPILWIAVLISTALHLLFVVFLPQPKQQLVVDQQRILQLRMKRITENKSGAISAVEGRASHTEKKWPDSARKQEQELKALSAEDVKVVPSKPVISTAEALRQALAEPSNFNRGIRCTPLQRRQRLINCDDVGGELDRFAESDLRRSLDASLAIVAPASERAMVLHSRQLLLQSQQLEEAVSIGANSEFLHSQVAEDLRQLRRQSDALDRQRSSLDLFGVTVDTYRASDSHTRNPNVFNQGRL